MATTKTIQPTGATITIPAFTDQPDIRPIATDLSNITDAANALSDHITSMAQSVTFARTAATTHDITVPSNSAHFLVIDTSAGSRFLYARVLSSAAGSLTIEEIAKGSDVTVSRGTNTLTITLGGSATITVVDFIIRGNACS